MSRQWSATRPTSPRLQGLAEPGTVVVAASTRRLLGDRFRLRDLGRQAIKGWPRRSRPG
jgi:class 3 adenylate cyclase